MRTNTIRMNTRSGSQVCTEEKTKVEEKERTEEEKVLRLRLIEAKKIKWEEGTIDNEHLGRKSSKSKRNKEFWLITLTCFAS